MYTLFKKIFHHLYYAIVFIILVYGLKILLYRMWLTFHTRSFSLTLDTTYLHWNTSFPAVTICEIFNGEKNWDLSEKYYGVDRHRKIDDFVADLSFYSGNCYTCSLCETELNCPQNYTDILFKFRSSCEEMIFNCSWNNIEFNCCHIFLPLTTEYGTCYTINSIHTNPPFGKRLINNRQTGPGTLKFDVFEDVQIHLHSPNEIPYLNEADVSETILFGLEKEIIISIIEIINDRNAVDVSIRHRNCRFTWELDEGMQTLYKLYGRSTCIAECSKNIQLKLCNCTHHLMPRHNERQCDAKGLICLSENFAQLTNERKNCQCLGNCEEPEYNTIYTSNEEYREEPGSAVTISLLELPKQRYIRSTVKTTLDFVISVGGVVGLFFDMSILSLLGIIYEFIIKTQWSISLKKFRRI